MIATTTAIAPLVKEVSIKASAQSVWQAITDKDQMKEWYFDLAAFRPEVGFRFEFPSNCEGENFYHICEVTEVIPGKRISYTWEYKDTPGTSTVTFELFEEAGGTKLVLTHAGIETFPQDDAVFGKNSFSSGWEDMICNALPAYIEQKS
jgi:uncharacterized protein YndB with AHSA1/START domain